MLCPNCQSTNHRRCCAWCGKVHPPSREHHEHCTTKCAREAARADRISAAMEDDH